MKFWLQNEKMLHFKTTWNTIPSVTSAVLTRFPNRINNLFNGLPNLLPDGLPFIPLGFLLVLPTLIKESNPTIWNGSMYVGIYTTSKTSLLFRCHILDVCDLSWRGQVSNSGRLFRESQIPGDCGLLQTVLSGGRPQNIHTWYDRRLLTGFSSQRSNVRWVRKKYN